MKTLLQLSICLLFSNTVYSQCPTNKIIYPNGNEEFSANSVIDVSIELVPISYPGINPEYCYLYFSSDGGNTWSLPDTIPIDTAALFVDHIVTFQWVVPNVISNDCLLRFNRFESHFCCCYDFSDNSFIVSPAPKRLNKGSLKVYPNPAKTGEKITVVAIDFEDFIDIRLMDANGKLIQEYLNKKAALKVDTERLSPGLYYIMVQSDKEVSSQKLIIH